MTEMSLNLNEIPTSPLSELAQPYKQKILQRNKLALDRKFSWAKKINQYIITFLTFSLAEILFCYMKQNLLTFNIKSQNTKCQKNINSDRNDEKPKKNLIRIKILILLLKL